MSVFIDVSAGPASPLPVVRRAAVALCVGELDPTGRLGLLADARALAAIGARAAVVPTFCAGASFDSETVTATWDQVHADLPVDAIKLGRLGGERTTRALAERLEAAAHPRVVVDPCFLDTRGEPRISDAVATAWREHILPHALVVTVNQIEVWRLFGRPCEDRRAMLEAAHRLYDLGPKWVVVTGGRLEGHPIDLAFDGTGFVELGADRVSGNRLPHTGGTFSATLTGALARGLAVPAALELARAAVNAALSGASPLLEHGAMIEPMAATYAALGGRSGARRGLGGVDAEAASATDATP
jgi:hydroxymethylpyrimidine/phosphomethylpyrimidine kinase